MARTRLHQVQVDRRTFLAAAGLGMAGLAVPPLARASNRPARAPGEAIHHAAAGVDPMIDALAMSLDYDTERIYRFVSDEVRYEPYAGVLRGASGTAWSRAGNAADQAVLLAALLDASLVVRRFAWAPIGDPEAAALLDAGLHDSATAQSDGLEVISGEGLGQPPVAVPALDPETLAAIELSPEQADATVTWAREQTQADVDAITSTLSAAGITVPTGTSDLPPTERQQHVWVQVLVGGTWVDLDPTLPGREPGDTVSTAVETASSLPDALWHRAELAVVSDVVVDGVVTEVPQLVVDTTIAQLDMEPIVFFNARPEGLEGLGLSIAGSLTGRANYLPTIIAGDLASVGTTPISFAVSEVPMATGDAAAVEGEPLAQWLRLTLTGPGVAPVVVRRPVFDRVGPAARASGSIDLAAVPPVPTGSLTEGGPIEAQPALATLWLSVTGSRSTAAVSRRPPADPESLVAPAGLPQLQHLEEHAVGLDIATGSGLWLFPDGPNVVCSVMSVEGIGEGAIRTTARADIWHRSHGALPLRGASVATPSPAILAGVVPHTAERLVVGESLVRADSPLPVGLSVGALLRAAESQGIPLVAIRDTTAAGSMPYPADALARLQASVATGRVAVAPAQPVLVDGVPRAGWWLVDPATGRTVDELDDGRGAAMPERVIIIPVQAEQASAYVRLSCAAAGVGAMTALLAGGFAVIAADDVPAALSFIILASGTVGATVYNGGLCIAG